MKEKWMRLMIETREAVESSKEVPTRTKEKKDEGPLSPEDW
jgi:hypothetical protein